MRGERFRSFVADPDVAAFFKAYEADRIERLLRAGAADDDARRSAALEINAMREFKSFITSAIAAGDHASTILQKENT